MPPQGRIYWFSLTSRKPKDSADLEPFVIAVVPHDPCNSNTKENKDAEGTTSSSQDEDRVTSSEDKSIANPSLIGSPLRKLMSSIKAPCVEKDSEVPTATVSVRLLEGKLPVKEHGRKEVISLPLVAVFLIKMKTNNRIHDALKLQVDSHSRWDTSLVKKIAKYAPPTSSQEVNSLLPELPKSQEPDKALDGLEKFKLNTSQQKAVLVCVSAMDQGNCWVRLVWGPPGTGKTRAIVSLLWSMLMKNRRTLTCAPTNTAMMEVASRLLSLLEDDFYGGGGRDFSLGDVILYGNEEWINVDGNLSKILERRASRLHDANWRYLLNCMFELLDRPFRMHSYLKDVRSVRTGDILLREGVGDVELKRRRKMTFKDFFLDSYESREEALYSCLETLRRDLPRSYTTSVDQVLQSVKAFAKLLRSETERPLQKLFSKKGVWPEFQEARALCLAKLKHFSDHFDLPNTADKIEEFILSRAKIVLCTACSSFNLRCVRNAPRFHLLVVDEAAQLKECELLIPLQLGIRSAVLIGDECQLPALVKSKLSAKADFGRSLFERLSMLGHPKHLLDVQYRMHPEISKFPLSRFYRSKVTDSPNIVQRDYERKLLAGPMYGPYSFINIQGGMESSGKHDTSLRNAVEVAAVTRIV
uniref:Uncharacterized protein n=7 Tax=Avena sativa TaxID=4498 RepID=A0ACD6AL33_AVESA